MILQKFEAFLCEHFDRKETIRAYLKDVEMFLFYTESLGLECSDVKERHIKNYNIKLKQDGYTDHSISRKNSSMRLFFKYLRKTEHMQHNPMEDIKQPTLEKRDVRLTDDEKRLLRQTMQEDARAYLMYTFLVEEKMKVSDLVRLKWGDIDTQNHIIYLQKKASTVNERTIERLKLLEIKEESCYLFQNQKGESLSVNGVHYILKEYFKKIGRLDLRPNDLTK